MPDLNYVEQLTINDTDYDIHAKNVITRLEDMEQDDNHKVVTQTQIDNWTQKADPGDIPTKLSQLEEDSNSLHLTSTLKNTWNNKASTDVVTQSTNGLMSSTDKTKLDGVAVGATANTGTVTSITVKMNDSTKGTITTSGTIDLGTVITDLSGYTPTATQQAIDSAQNTAISNLSTNKIDEPALEGSSGYVLTTNGEGGRSWEPVASQYVLPVATESTLGGIKSGTDISVDANGNVSVLDDSHNHIIANIDDLQTTLDNKINKEALFDAGVKSTSYSLVKSFTATTEVTEGFTYPRALIDLTYDFNKTKRYKIIFNGTEYIIPCELAMAMSISGSAFASYEYLGNVTLSGNTADYNNGFYPVRSELPFILEFERTYDLSNKLELFTQTAGTYTVEIYEETLVATSIPNELVWGSSFHPYKLKSGGTRCYSTVSIGGTNYASSSRGSVLIGENNTSTSDFSVAIGFKNTVTGADAVALGWNNTSSGQGSLAEGCSSTSSGNSSHCEGYTTTASGNYSHSEGRGSIASAQSAHAEGQYSTASSAASHSEGQRTVASGPLSHAGGNYGEASGRASFTHGNYCNATQPSQFVIGYGNNPQSDSIFEIGNGLDSNGNPNNSVNSEPATRQNAFRVTQSGSAIAQTSLGIVKSNGTIASINATQLENVISCPSDLTAHTSNSDIHVTTSDKSTWSGKQKNIYQQDDAPSNPSTGDLWIETDAVLPITNPQWGMITGTLSNQTDLNSILTSQSTSILDINSKIPSQATSQNQLADKNFVNSSISTNTANYISNNGQPFTSVQQLELYSGEVTHNDYAFVTGTDEQGNSYFDRYKATVSGSTVTWAKEYRLNNSSFTSIQWSAINSGITESLVNNIHTHSNKNTLDGITATAQEINTLSGITANTEELNYCSGVTSGIQTQLNNKISEPSSEGINGQVLVTNGNGIRIWTSLTIFNTGTASSFVAETTPTLTEYIYAASITDSNITVNDKVYVEFSPAQINSNSFGPLTQSYNGGFYIYSNNEHVGETVTVNYTIFKG